MIDADRQGSLRDTWATPFQLLAEVYLRQGETAPARALLTEYLPVCRQSGKRRNIPECLETVAGLLTAECEAGAAARLFGAAEALREQLRYPVRRADRPIHDERVAAIRAVLGADAFASAWSEGRRLSAEQALDLAMP